MYFFMQVQLSRFYKGTVHQAVMLEKGKSIRPLLLKKLMRLT